MKIILFIVSLIIVLVASFYLLSQKIPVISPLGKGSQKPLEKYTFDNLKKTKFSPSNITLGDVVSQTNDYTSQLFFFTVEKKKVSGLMNIPKKDGPHPVIVMFRGFAEKTNYQSGIGTQPSAAVFATHGYITLAPDFLGYGKSDPGAIDSFEDRFQTYTTGLTLLSSLRNLNSGLSASYSGTIQANLSQVGIWGHSNGGHIALSVLEISGLAYPTVLWAPVSKSFPYSILYYTDESDSQGKVLRKYLSVFEKDYDVDKFSPSNYYKWISKTPIEIHQGTNDHEVPFWWTDDLVTTLKKNNDTVEYFTYPGADHNLLPDGWDIAVSRSMQFYDKHFQ